MTRTAPLHKFAAVLAFATLGVLAALDASAFEPAPPGPRPVPGLAPVPYPNFDARPGSAMFDPAPSAPTQLSICYTRMTIASKVGSATTLVKRKCDPNEHAGHIRDLG